MFQDHYQEGAVRLVQVGKLLLVLGLGLMGSCGESDRPLNVILIGVDTLRPDHLGCYGYPRNTSPNIDELAGEGVLCENVVSQCPWTTPSFGTVFTSLYPTQHGAGSLEECLRSESTTLAEILQAKGYATCALVSNPALSPQFGLDRGFEIYDIDYHSEGRTADEVTGLVLNWLDGNSGRPFFIFAHYFDPHLSYAPPAPFDTLFDPDYGGTLGNSFGKGVFPNIKANNYEALRSLTPADWNHLISLYDGEIAYMDRSLGVLFRGLKDRKLWASTLIVFLSDHGEEFWEHGGFGHGHTLFNELIRVPLIFSLPATLPSGKRLAPQVRLLDVAPTILDLLDADPVSRFEGVSLEPLLSGKGRVEQDGGDLLGPEMALSEALFRGPEQKSIVIYPWKLIYNTSTEGEMVFNLADDPGEQVILTGGSQAAGKVLENVLTRAMLGMSRSWYVEIAGNGKDGVFDIEITTERSPVSVSIRFFRILDGEGNLLDSGRLPDLDLTDRSIRLSGFEPQGRLTLAFKTDPLRGPVNFDISIDESPATGLTYIGGQSAHPEEMPFALKSERTSVALGHPSVRPDPPYCLVWSTGHEDEQANRIELDEATKKELRALGYIQ